MKGRLKRFGTASLLAPAFLLTLGLCACSHGAPPPSTSPTFAASMHAAATTSPSQLTWKTDRVVIFKDGYGLLAKSGSGTADAQGDAFTDDVPDAAVLGCFWAIAEVDRGVNIWSSMPYGCRRANATPPSARRRSR